MRLRVWREWAGVPTAVEILGLYLYFQRLAQYFKGGRFAFPLPAHSLLKLLFFAGFYFKIR